MFFTDTLPLKATSSLKVAVIGPNSNATKTMLGNYHVSYVSMLVCIRVCVCVCMCQNEQNMPDVWQAWHAAIAGAMKKKKKSQNRMSPASLVDHCHPIKRKREVIYLTYAYHSLLVSGLECACVCVCVCVCVCARTRSCVCVCVCACVLCKILSHSSTVTVDVLTALQSHTLWACSFFLRT